jgi:DNA-binding NarL/FixJ family response regulator
MRAQQSANSVSILIADDHEVARRGLRAILESDPDLYVVAEASDGREALEKAKAYTPSVILMDIGMPKMNGVEATRQLHKELPEAQVLIITMHFSEELLKEAMGAGAMGYLLKTDADSELVSAIHSLSRQQCYFSPRFDCRASGASGGKIKRRTDAQRTRGTAVAHGRPEQR